MISEARDSVIVTLTNLFWWLKIYTRSKENHPSNQEAQRYEARFSSLEPSVQQLKEALP